MKKVGAIIVISIAFFSCTSKPIMGNVQDKKLTIQVMKVKGEEGGSAYKVRLFHEFKGEEVARQHLNENLQYHIDSVFYQLNGAVKQYASSVIPVANGLKNSFEYLVFFDTDEGNAEGLIYKDKYITGKTYQLNLK